MPDIVSPAVRSRMMAGIRGKNTKPELIVRSGLHRLGFRFRLHKKDLPGKPDLVLKKHNAVVFVNGCFWHGHPCHLFKLPSSRTTFWKAKILRNQRNDQRATVALRAQNWRVLTIWECSIKGRERIDPAFFMNRIQNWLFSKRKTGEIRGKRKRY